MQGYCSLFGHVVSYMIFVSVFFLIAEVIKVNSPTKWFKYKLSVGISYQSWYSQTEKKQ